MFDSVGPEVLDRLACLELLGSVGLGRIVYTERAMPAIQPVQFTVHEEAVIIRASPGGKLSAAARGAVVAFEAGSFSDDLSSGWSVRVVGQATEIRCPHEVAMLKGVSLPGWSPAPDDLYLRIPIEVVSGRRIRDDQNGIKPALSQ